MVVDQIDKEIFEREYQIEKYGYDCYNHFDVEMLGEIHGLKLARKIILGNKNEKKWTNNMNYKVFLASMCRGRGKAEAKLTHK